MSKRGKQPHNVYFEKLAEKVYEELPMLLFKIVTQTQMLMA